jgi:hypothetical protein
MCCFRILLLKVTPESVVFFRAPNICRSGGERLVRFQSSALEVMCLVNDKEIDRIAQEYRDEFTAHEIVAGRPAPKFAKSVMVVVK